MGGGNLQYDREIMHINNLWFYFLPLRVKREFVFEVTFTARMRIAAERGSVDFYTVADICVVFKRHIENR